MDNLPIEVIIDIMIRADMMSLLNLRYVSSKLYNIFNQNEEYIISKKIKNDFNGRALSIVRLTGIYDYFIHEVNFHMNREDYHSIVFLLSDLKRRGYKYYDTIVSYVSSTISYITHVLSEWVIYELVILGVRLDERYVSHILVNMSYEDIYNFFNICQYKIQDSYIRIIFYRVSRDNLNKFTCDLTLLKMLKKFLVKKNKLLLCSYIDTYIVNTPMYTHDNCEFCCNKTKYDIYNKLFK